jgi:hypothetical protein
MIPFRGRSISADEVRVRGAQALAALIERSGFSSQLHEADDDAFLRRGLSDAYAGCGLDELLADFRESAKRPRFFASMTDPDATRALIRSRWPAAEREVLERADRICAGEFDLLGRSRLALGSPPDWHLEPLSRKRTPLVHWTRIDHLDAEAAGEYKLVWELSRHQYFVTLGKAYLYSGDESYAETLVAHLGSWMDSNPPKRGTNWSSSLELSFRVISWVWALQFLRRSPALTPSLYLRVLKLVSLQARHVETYLSTYFSPNTHLTGEALGLFYIGTLFPELKRAAEWQRAGLRILTDQIGIQVGKDGVYFEQATYYHRYTADFYLHLLLLARENAVPVEGVVEAKLRALLDHLMFMTQPDGTTPLFGDDDGGRLVQLDARAPNDFRDTLAVGAAVFARPDYKLVSGDAPEGLLWLLGSQGLERFESLPSSPPDRASVAFREGGYFVMRDHWGADASCLTIDCGPHGVLNCGHAHADALSFVLAAGGRTFLVDPGTYTYIFPLTMRDELRRSRSHNSVTVNGESSSVPGGPFQWKRIAHSSAERWISRERFDYFAGSHRGYERPGDPVRHRRAVFFLKGAYWLIHDRLSAVGEHNVELTFQFAPGVELATEGDRVSASMSGQGGGPGRLHLLALGRSLAIRCEEGSVSRSFGELSSGPRCVLSTRGRGTQETVVLIAPGGLPCARQLPAAGGLAIRIAGQEGTDLILIGGGDVVSAEGVESDFEWTWLRRAREGGEVREIAGIAGRRLTVDGREVVASRVPLGHLFVDLADGEPRVDTDASDPVPPGSIAAGLAPFDAPDDARVASGPRRG